MANRRGERRLFLENGRTYFGTGSDLKYTLDLHTRQHRQSTISDVAAAASVCDHLDNIDFIMSYGLPEDVPQTCIELHQLYAMLTHNSKKSIIMTSFNTDTLRGMYNMAAVVAGGEERFAQNPFIVLYGQFISPFLHTADGLERLIFCAERRLPVIYIPTIMGGASGPVTMAGSLAVANAETLAGLVISQLVRKGAPFIYGGCVMPFDMRDSVVPYGAPEWAMASAVLSQLSMRYRLPVFSTAGCTDSHVVDSQASIEGTLSILMAALSGANIIHDVGYLGQGMIGSLEYLVMMDEVIAMVKRVLSGFTVDRETLALDLIDEVGPGGDFFQTAHTLKHFRSEVWYSQLLTKTENSGRLEDRARQRALDILQQTEPEPLPDEIDRELKRILVAHL